MAKMENSEVAAVFYEIADLLYIHGGNPHRIRAFSRTARTVENLPDSCENMLRFGTLAKVPGIGDGSVRRIKDILRTGTCDEHLKLRRALPAGLRDMLEVKGLGPRTIRVIYQHLRIGTIAELEHAIRTGQVQKLPRMGQRTGEKLLKGIEDWKNRLGRVPWVDARRQVGRLTDQLREHPAILKMMVGGSVRRGKATIGDLDILVGADDKLAVVSKFMTLPEIDEVLVHGEGRVSVRLHNRQQCDLRVLDPECFGAGMHYFTGSKLHNIAIRVRGLKLFDRKISDKGIFVRDTEIRLSPATEEEEIFAAVGLPYIAPELRENTGEIEAAAAGRLPRLVEAGDLRGDLHMHTIASDGKGTVADMAEAAVKMGHRYIAITDHTKHLEVANGLDERRLTAQVRHIRDVEQDVGRLHILAGTEVDILPDGALDIDASVLQGLDWVVASVHSGFGQSGAEITERYIRAMETGLVDCIGHPETRRLGHRKGVQLDLDRLLKAARKTGVALEINGNPYRMDLSDTSARRAKEAGVPVCINTDAHAPGHLVYQEFGLITARRGWIEPGDVLNARDVTVLRERRKDRLRTHGIAVSGWDPQIEGNVEALVYPEVFTSAEHWPESDRIHGAADEEEPEVVPVDPEAETGLDAALAEPLTDALRGRIDDYLRNGGDPELEAALARKGPNAMQAAFNLLFGGGG
ncbi:MAG: DNA polymerase/3'-5' exonuclease PolX [Alphaproteobacteria bacterium]|nr:DNA polymerase/3'-5' exonuclease PolX [Alphaproteobacteria bacterium]